MKYTKIINGQPYTFKVSCLKYSRVYKTWVMFSKADQKRKPMPISNEYAESLVSEYRIKLTRHDKGDYVLFKVNANSSIYTLFIEKRAFDPSKDL